MGKNGPGGGGGVWQDPVRRGRSSHGSDPSRICQEGRVSWRRFSGSCSALGSRGALGGPVPVPPWPWWGAGRWGGGDTGGRSEFVETADLRAAQPRKPRPSLTGRWAERGGRTPGAGVMLCHSCRAGTRPRSRLQTSRSSGLNPDTMRTFLPNSPHPWCPALRSP